MKLIEETIKSNLRRKLVKDTDSEVNIQRTAWYDTGFKEGIEFAERWISVEKELPDNCTDYVLFKNNYGDVFIGLCKKAVNLWVDNNGRFFLCDEITYWRPISFY